MKLFQAVFSFTTLSLLLLPSMTSSQTCRRSCGKLSLKFPFGSGPGCGDPRFQQYVTCNIIDDHQEQLTFTTHTGSYQVTAIDYANQVLYISDPSMSTCSCINTQPNKGFGLDWEAPFSFHDDTIFALLDCSLSSSPIYHSDDGTNGSDYKVPLCDSQGTVPICSYLYSCRAISTISLPISTCCVYTPVDLGPAYEMDLEKLKCTSYSGFYSFNGRKSDPDSWNYGIALKYKFSVYNEYPSSCAECERSYGACGYNGLYNSFTCNCPSGINTTKYCSFGENYNLGSRLLPWKTGAVGMVYCLAWLLVWVL
ncbi:Wall-associated receptor kinase [Parasponia andersonii]|uniref:non-specific serine/threonine protein kinase n=1 Tax=Parasponia andersonii TaxID=3476 RepID=A0A2P5D2K6_PARAD|nr:Wall-associated receptor kinase [Parasponia andersonii]